MPSVLNTNGMQPTLSTVSVRPLSRPFGESVAALLRWQRPAEDMAVSVSSRRSPIDAR